MGPRFGVNGLSGLGAAVLVVAGLAACDTGKVDPATSSLITAAKQDADSFRVVDCKLPPQVRQLGQRATFLTAQRVIKTSAGECEIRGGEYIAYDRADLATAISFWQPQAAGGDPKAQTYLGEIYERGLGGQPPDYESAALWYRRAAEQNYTPAQINLGQLYEQGRGVAKDEATALNWYRKASGLGVTFVASADTAAEITSLRSQVSEREAANAALSTRVSEEKRRADRAQAQRTQEVASADRERRELAAERARLEQERRELALAGSQATPAAPSSAADQARLSAREADLKALETKLSTWQAEVEQREQGVAAREGDQERMRTELAAARQQLAETETALAARRASLSREQAAVVQVGEDAAQREQLAASRQAELDRLAALLAARQAEVSAREAQLQAEQAGLTEQAAAESARVIQALAQVKSQLDEGQAQLAQQRQQLAAAAASLEAKNQSIAAREQELQAKEQSLSEREAELTALDARIQEVSQAAKTQVAALVGLVGETDAVPAAAESRGQAPIITVLDPTLSGATRSGIPEVTVRGNLVTRTVVGKVEASSRVVALTVNDARQQPDEDGVFSAEVPLLSADATEVDIVAVDAAARRTQVRFLLRPSSPPPGSAVATAEQAGAAGPALPAVDARGIDFGQYHALVIGNNDYRSLSKLDTARNDAQEVAATLQRKYGFRVKLLLDADRYAILSALNDLRSTLTENDNLLIYYAGHGTLEEKNQRGYWLPVDAELDNNANWISNVDLTDILNAMNAKRVLVIADSCYSGTLTRSSQARLAAGMTAAARRSWVETISQKRARMALTSGGLAPVLDAGGGEHSIFAKALLDVLRDNRGLLDGDEIYREVTVRVSYAAKAVQFEQLPQYAPIKYAGHEAGEFFMLASAGS